MAAPKMTKNQMRRAKKKEQKKVQQAEPTINPEQEKGENEEQTEETNTTTGTDSNTTDKKGHDAESRVTTEAPALDDDLDQDPAFAVYKDIFTKFGASLEEDEIAKEANAGNQGTVLYADDDNIPDEDDQDEKPKLSKKKRKELNKLSVAELKALVSIPEVVEWHDVSSSDPRVLVQIKAQRNVVPVPTHWSLKREYLSSKRGIEKAPFRLPQFISDTGITEMRDAVLEKQAEQTLKQKQRERVAPKMGRLDIDYQKLYDAFFRFQTKPELTRFGEVYYEGKEAEVDYQHFRPGDLTEATKEALGMPAGAPPPWLINQQRYGPPPSYPTLKIPGLNAPPPPGGSWGFHPGGWGKPPVDESNRPLYGGDVFGLAQNGAQPQAAQGQLQLGDAVERTLWGELQPREESEEEESEEESEEEEEDADAGGLETPSGMETPSGYSTNLNEYGSGIETSMAGEMDLRKERRGYDTEESSAPRSAYTVLPERQVRAEGFFGSDRVYDLKAGQQAGMPVLGSEDGSRKRKKPGDVDVALDVDSLNQHDGISKDALRQQFEDTNRQEGLGAKWAHDDDLTDLIAEEYHKRQRTEKERQDKKKESRYRF
ncbi:PSP domain-containing protein [Pochonia chlamydosporia 170]|uniref:PSP domain-containing protein n=1 Tax=Pochonia chlamydosporia 170 TaxID=1380566 RepID=A0A179G1A6_METCM|nr:PSP domain-containing protein [Pochonia chlamydosporia 170]OAQ71133.1 PSP domain-containing protein [Pochonia chlamydosporia 170]